VEVAIDVYAEHGWRGFNFESVSTAAQVGRPALYRRWPDRSALLIDAFLRTTPEVADTDLGVLHDELLRVLTDYQQVVRGSRGRAGQRLYLDRAAIPEVVASVHERLMGRRFEVVSAAIRRAVEREGKASAVPDRLVFSFLLGAVLLWSPDGAQSPPVDAEAVVASVIQLTRLTDT
jgi:AcrR family transcriptional regulator